MAKAKVRGSANKNDNNTFWQMWQIKAPVIPETDAKAICIKATYFALRLMRIPTRRGVTVVPTDAPNNRKTAHSNPIVSVAVNTAKTLETTEDDCIIAVISTPIINSKA